MTPQNLIRLRALADKLTRKIGPKKRAFSKPFGKKLDWGNKDR